MRMIEGDQKTTRLDILANIPLGYGNGCYHVDNDLSDTHILQLVKVSKPIGIGFTKTSMEIDYASRVLAFVVHLSPLDRLRTALTDSRCIT